MIVDIVEEQNFFERASFVRSYTDFVVECRQRMRIHKVINDHKPTQVIIAKIEVLNESLQEEDEVFNKEVVEEL